MNLKTALQELYSRYRSDLPDYAWESEAERWSELVFCLLNQQSSQEPEYLRSAIAVLQELGLLDVERLAAITEATAQSEDTVVLTTVLKRYGFSAEEAQSSAILLAHVAGILQRNYKGKIQHYLRIHGQALVNALMNDFDSEVMDEAHLRYAVTHWLQNVLSLPLSLAHPAVLRYCRRFGVTLDDLLSAVDELDLNIALVDDLLEMEEQLQELRETEEARNA